MPRICLITPAHLGSNPRIVKEANALKEAGYETHVIFADTFPGARERDAAILKHAPWTYEIVRRNALTSRLAAVRRKASVAFVRLGLKLSALCELAHHSLVNALGEAACRYPADLYIGHCLAGLPAAVKAARKNRSVGGFDAEDYHSQELIDEGLGRVQNKIAFHLENLYLPNIVHFTAASPLIAEDYHKRFGRLPDTILNVFPVSEAPVTSVQREGLEGIPRFYWFSQTVGPGRGLEDVLRIAKCLQRPLSFDFRGHCAKDYELHLQRIVAGTSIQLRILPPENPELMVALASGYTAGLALEQSHPRNRDICLTNKAFTYLLAGVPVILSKTSAHTRLAAELRDAALLMDMGSDGSANSLSAWLDSQQPLLGAKMAWILARQKYNWDSEKEHLLNAVSRSLHRGKCGRQASVMQMRKSV